MSEPVHYQSYLKLDQLLSSQSRKSEEIGRPAHDEMLFIIVHQAYELWFKQILFELQPIIESFSSEEVPEAEVGKSVSRLHRIIQIQRVLQDQLSVLETMTPLDFLEFRDLLVPASGFQSVQFRKIESALGLRQQDRVSFGGKQPESQLKEAESLFDMIDKWLARTPFLNFGDYDFFREYEQSVKKMLQKDRDIIQSNASLSPEGKKRQLASLEMTCQNFEALFDKRRYEALRADGERRLSYRATLAALFIFLYRDEPLLRQPFNFLMALIDVDENFTKWRYSHALMVHRMIGTKIGTGGSAGYDYLQMAAEKHKVFRDLFDLSTFLVPRSELPELPADFKAELNFHFSTKNAERNR